MKRSILILGVIAALFTACEDKVVVPTGGADTEQTELSSSVKNALSVMNQSNVLEKLGFEGPSLFSENRGMSLEGVSTSGRTNGQLKMMCDSTDTGHDFWCGEEEFIENADGSYTWTLDFGEEGCGDDEYFMKGKMIETFSGNDEGSFSSKIEFINFGDNYYVTNGTESFSGTFTYPMDMEDSANFEYNESFDYTMDLVITITEDDLEEEYTLVGEGRNVIDEKGFTVEKNDMKVTMSNGDFYSQSVSTPLYEDFNCTFGAEEDYMYYGGIFVSGVESYDYSEEGESGAFSLDYGDGTCDTMATVTENGESYEIDLSDFYYGDEDDDEGDNG